MTTSPTLPFPHPSLTPIDGKPTNSSIQILQRELFTNARSVVSNRGGGTNGHLALLLSPEAYIARAGIAFVPPEHPGPGPIHGNPATAGQITETNRQYAANLSEHSLYHQVSVELKKQLLAAIQPSYLHALEDADYGFADVSPFALLHHLHTTYGILTPEDLEINRLSLSHPWNPDAPIEDLWCRIKEVRRVAATAHDIISETAAINLTLTMLETAGLLSDATRAWRLHPITNWSLHRFTEELTNANRERLRQTTARSAGYHTAHLAAAAIPTKEQRPAIVNTTNAPPTVVSDDIRLYYCWTHGLGPSRTHTSATCNQRAPGHITSATISNMQGGSNTFNAIRQPGTSRRRSTAPNQNTLPTNN